MIPRPDPVRPLQESVSDCPRPPRLEAVRRRVKIELGGCVIAETTGTYRVLETSHPPNYYLPPDDIVPGTLARTHHRSLCEWKGQAHYFDVHAGERIESDAAWGYDWPSAAFEAHHRVRRLLCRPHGCVLGRRRTGRPAARWLLRRVDHRGAGGPLQGRSGQSGLVTPRKAAAAPMASAALGP